MNTLATLKAVVIYIKKCIALLNTANQPSPTVIPQKQIQAVESNSQLNSPLQSPLKKFNSRTRSKSQPNITSQSQLNSPLQSPLKKREPREKDKLNASQKGTQR